MNETEAALYLFDFCQGKSDERKKAIREAIAESYGQPFERVCGCVIPDRRETRCQKSTTVHNKHCGIHMVDTQVY